MKKICVLLMALLLLTGCSGNLSGALNVPDSPDGEFGDRPGYRPTEVSGTLSEEEIPVTPSGRNMAFEPTAESGLYRVLTRTGDLEVLGMTYGDGRFFAMTRRESGIAVTGYDDNGTGVFAGLINEELEDPVLLGFTAGFACIYAPGQNATLACRANGTYVQLIHESAEEVWLYDGGYAMRRGNVISLCLPNEKEPVATYTLPEGYAWVQGNQTGAWVEKDGKLHLLSADGKLSGGLSPLLTVTENGYYCQANGTSVVVNTLQGMAHPGAGEALLACGKDFSAEKTPEGLRLVLPAEGKAATLTGKGEITFGGRTKKGFLYRSDEGWFWFAASAMTPATLPVVSFSSLEDPLAMGAKLLLSVLEGKKNEKVCNDDHAYGTVVATGETDPATLYTALSLLLAEYEMPEGELYLCHAITVDGEAVRYHKTPMRFYLDISDPEEVHTIIQDYFFSEAKG